MDRRTAVRKLKACIRLSKSSNPHEAATAMRQARKLMDQYGLTLGDASDVNVSAQATRYKGKKGIPRRLQQLATTIAAMFRCVVIAKTRHGDRAELQFVGVGAMPDLAKYAFVQLERQLNRALSELRSEVKVPVKRWTRLRNDFADGWAVTACAQIPLPPEDPDHNEMLMTQYELIKNQVVVRKDSATERKARKRKRSPLFDLGVLRGQSAEVFQGMDGKQLAGLEQQR